MCYTVPRRPKESLQTYQSALLWQTGLLNPMLSFHLYFEWLAQLHAVRALQNRNTIVQNGNSDNMILVNHFLKNFGSYQGSPKTSQSYFKTLYILIVEKCCILKIKLYKIFHYFMYCYAKSLQSCPTLCDPIDRSPPGLPVPGILQVRTLEWVAISFSKA